MCGIAGFVGENVGQGGSEMVLKMMQAMKHRGPDGEATWTDPHGRCVLGHKRLAIIDPEGGQQPMSNEDDTIWIVFNGCIYNYEDLARLLREKGHRFKTHSDTEVIIHAYEEWGTECVHRFNGMWAFGVWDSKKGTLFCSRDRLGIKPFYYVWDGHTFTFGSEIKTLLAAGVVSPSPNPDGLRQFLTFQYCLGETSLFNSVRKLPAGHNLILKGGQQPQVSCFWDVSFDIDEEHDEEYFIDRLEWLLEDAVRLRLRADVPLGAHLSGGLDSSAIVSISRLLLGDAPLKTFNGSFHEGQDFDESHYAQVAADAAKTQHMGIRITADDFTQSIKKIIWHMDEPAAGPGVFPQYWVSKLASENVKVVLGGQGGDEIFIGYARYLAAYLEECLKGAIEGTAHRHHYVATLGTIVPNLPSLEKYMPLLKDFWRDGLFDAPAKRYFRLMDRFADGQSLLSSDVKLKHGDTFKEFESIFESHGAAAMINRIMCFDLKTHLEALLQVEDRTSMAWGLESRVPLLDHRLIELMASIPPVIKFKNGQLKYLFRRAIRNLVPSEILARKDKMGFPVPLAQWFQKDLRDFIRDLLLDKRCRERGIFDSKRLEDAIASEEPFNRSIWGALCLELWHRNFIDGEGLSDLT